MLDPPSVDRPSELQALGNGDRPGGAAWQPRTNANKFAADLTEGDEPAAGRMRRRRRVRATLYDRLFVRTTGRPVGEGAWEALLLMLLPSCCGLQPNENPTHCATNRIPGL